MARKKRNDLAKTENDNSESETLNSDIEENIKVESIPGPCSIIQALVLSGFETSPFQFLGFLPKKENKLNFYTLRRSFTYNHYLKLQKERFGT